MWVSYGSYTHDNKSVTPRVSSSIVRTGRGEAYGVQYRIDLQGAVFGDDQSTLISNIRSAIDAYAVDGGDFAFRFNDLTAAPDLHIRSDECIGGVQVVSRPTFDPQFPAEYSTFWHFTASLEALVRLHPVNTPVLLEFNESVELVGTGGPKRVWVDLKNFRAQRQQPRPFTRCAATQRGTIVGLNNYMDAFLPAPFWPDLMDHESARRARSSPRRVRGSLVEFRTDYSYQFENNGPFPGLALPTTP